MVGELSLNLNSFNMCFHACIFSSASKDDIRHDVEHGYRSDNDQYAHMNNSIYYHLFDSIVNTYLIERCGQDPTSSPLIGLVVSSYCQVCYGLLAISFEEGCC